MLSIIGVHVFYDFKFGDHLIAKNSPKFSHHTILNLNNHTSSLAGTQATEPLCD